MDEMGEKHEKNFCVDNKLHHTGRKCIQFLCCEYKGKCGHIKGAEPFRVVRIQ